MPTCRVVVLSYMFIFVRMSQLMKRVNDRYISVSIFLKKKNFTQSFVFNRKCINQNVKPGTGTEPSM